MNNRKFGIYDFMMMDIYKERHKDKNDKKRWGGHMRIIREEIIKGQHFYDAVNVAQRKIPINK